jgi:tRNA pseudouridine65 synthase
VWHERYRDEWVTVIDKPSGWIVHRGMAADAETVVSLARTHTERPVYPVHRLDRGTSGVLILAHDPESARRLQESFRAGAVNKRYLALVRGIPPATGVVDHAIPKGEGSERVPARTEFIRRAMVAERYALVEAKPEQGRFHQVRRHLKHISCPIIGDANYGKAEHNKLWRERYGLARLALHAWSVSFPHPRHRQDVIVTAPLAHDFASALRLAGCDWASCVGQEITGRS